MLIDGVIAAQREQMKRAGERFQQSAVDRERNLRAREQSNTAVHDSIDALQVRAERLVLANETPVEALTNAVMTETPSRQIALERIIGASKDLQSWNFLPRGARVATTVARISELENGRVLPLGTGFLVSPRLLMTNNHVLPHHDAARGVIIEFGAQIGIDNEPGLPTVYRLNPEAFFVTDQHLDFTLVLVQPNTEGMPPGELFGWNHLISMPGKIVVGEPVNIVGHPMGRLKEISIRKNELQLRTDEFLQYSTDTEPGNSGSPVFNDQWEVVALHHSGVPRIDDQGRLLRKDGKIWEEGDGDDAIDWISNEGVRVSVILEHLRGLHLDAEQQEVLDELGPQAVSIPVRPEFAGKEIGGVILPQRGRAPQPAPLPLPKKGLAGRDGDGPHLVFLHGRSQQGKDPAVLRNTWTAGLNAGLTLAGQTTVDPSRVWFPFYGDQLLQTLSAQESISLTPESATPVSEALAPRDDLTRQVYGALLDRAAARAGMPDEFRISRQAAASEGLGEIGATLVERFQRQLSWLAARSGLDELTIGLIFRDVAAYLSHPEVRDAVLGAVMETLPSSGRIVLVSHSLGTVVAMDLLTRLDTGVDVALLVTAGSPLGMDAVYDRLLVGGAHRPARARAWLNAWCPADAVAIGCPLIPTWGRDLTEMLTDNDRDRAHSIEEYLGDPAVARSINAALTAAPTTAA